MYNVLTTTLDATPRNARRVKYLLNLRGVEIPYSIEKMSEIPTLDEERISKLPFKISDAKREMFQYLDDFDSRSIVVGRTVIGAFYNTILYALYKDFKDIGVFITRTSKYSDFINIAKQYFAKVVVLSGDGHKTVHENVFVEDTEKTITIMKYSELKSRDVFAEYKFDFAICDSLIEGSSYIPRQIEYISQECDKIVAITVVDKEEHKSKFFDVHNYFLSTFMIITMLRPNNALKSLADCHKYKKKNETLKHYKGSLYDLFVSSGCYMGLLSDKDIGIARNTGILSKASVQAY